MHHKSPNKSFYFGVKLVETNCQALVPHKSHPLRPNHHHHLSPPHPLTLKHGGAVTQKNQQLKYSKNDPIPSTQPVNNFQADSERKYIV